ncbi:MAG: thermonuclease family protein [Gallionella sp.]|jgi:endonuclease YncB( thermonuclease family)|nr:thermonuclease family protein [Gallionella sp.]MCK9354613.1 thermonuclease family protein [Gallionella sp.]
MKPIRILLLLLVALLAATAAQGANTPAQVFTAEVIAVLDGDTLLVTRGGKPLKLRLAEIDAPEKAQPYGTASQKSLADMVMRQQVQVESRAVDDYGRIVAMVSVAGLNVNHEQVRRGLAWEYSRFHSNRELMALQREAQLAKRGLWAGDDIVEPSKWRKQHPSTVASPVAVSSVAASTAASVASDESGCGKARCSEMTSCADARRYYERCGGKPLDGDHDGRPCEKLCAAEGVKLR